jgi:hypothetical protein
VFAATSLFHLLQKTPILVGPAGQPEPNINRLKVGPRGWVYGSTEENGWLFIIDPATLAYVQWNGGRTSPLPDARFEGDITDFVVWEESGKLVILACQATPAEIYRYDIPLPASGLPNPVTAMVQRVYSNPTWGRVMSIAAGRSSTGRLLLLAGSQLRGELIRSDDRGYTWRPVSYTGAAGDDLDSSYDSKKTWAATIAEIHFYVNPDTWIFYTRNEFLLAAEEPWHTGYRHTINMIATSRDGAATWQIADIPRNSRVQAPLADTITDDIESGRLLPDSMGLWVRTPRTWYGFVAGA